MGRRLVTFHRLWKDFSLQAAISFTKVWYNTGLKFVKITTRISSEQVTFLGSWLLIDIHLYKEEENTDIRTYMPKVVAQK